jgi:hypothetical protein
MARFWKVNRGTKLIPKYCYYVEVCSFTFYFWSLEALRETLMFYELKIHPSSIQSPPHEGKNWMERDVYERWWERLPMRLQQNNKRPKVVKALRKSLQEFFD